METSTGFEPVYTVLQTVTWPLGHDVIGAGEGKGGAEDCFRSLNSSNVGGTSIRAFRRKATGHSAQCQVGEAGLTEDRPASPRQRTTVAVIVIGFQPHDVSTDGVAV
jgi:hypothetical protein